MYSTYLPIPEGEFIDYLSLMTPPPFPPHQTGFVPVSLKETCYVDTWVGLRLRTDELVGSKKGVIDANTTLLYCSR